MPPRRQRMSEALQLRGLSAWTQKRDGRAVRHLAEHSHTSPARLTEEELRDSFLSLKNSTHYARSASPMALYGLPCFPEPTLTREWTTRTCVRPSQEPFLPGGRLPR